MAIKYLAGERLIGTAAERAGMTTNLPDIDLEMSGNTEDGITWTFGTGGSISSGKFVVNTTSNAYSTYDLGAGGALDIGTQFVCDLDFTRDTGDYGDGDYIDLNSEDVLYTSPTNGNRNIQIIGITNQNSTGSYVRVRTSGGTEYETGTAPTYLQGTGTTRYVRIFHGQTTDKIRLLIYTSATDRDNNTYGNAASDTTSAAAINSAFYSSANMRYLHMTSKNSQQSTFKVDNFKFWNDTLTTTVYPDLPNGAIFEESDTGKHYMWDGTDTWNEMT